MTVKSKQCPECGRERLAKYFGKDRGKKSGLQSWCVDCIDAQHKHIKVHWVDATCGSRRRRTSDNPEAITCKFCLRRQDDRTYRGRGRLKCDLCGRPYADHAVVEWHTA